MLDKRVQISSDRERSNGMANIDIVDRITWKIKEQKFSNKRIKRRKVKIQSLKLRERAIPQGITFI